VNQQRPVKPPFDPTAYPALRDVLPAYLHQDFTAEYGSAVEAANAFVSEASGDEILQVKEEWQALRNAFRTRPLHEFQDALRKLGSSWSPVDQAEVNDVDQILSSAQP
jgi:DNA topoisomerase IB